MYTIAEFRHEGDDGEIAMIEVDIVPSTWVKDGGKECWWPSANVYSNEKATQMARMCVPLPSGDEKKEWVEYKIKILCSSDDYLKARRKCHEAEEYSNLEITESEAPEDGSKRKTKRKRKAPRHFNPDEDSEDDSGKTKKLPPAPSAPKPPTVQSKSISKIKSISQSQPSTRPTTPVSRVANTKSVSKSQPSTRPSTPVTVTMNGAKNKPFAQSQPLTMSTLSDALGPALGILGTPPPRRPILASTPRSESSSNHSGLTDARFQTKVLRSLVDLKTLVMKNTAMIQRMIESSALSAVENDDDIQDIPTLPVESDTDLEELEELLKTKPTRRKLANNLSILGGKDIGSIVRSIMKALVTERVGAAYSFHGRKGKTAFVDKKNVLTLIYGAVRRNPYGKELSNADIDHAVGEWLKYCPSRLAGNRKRSGHKEALASRNANGDAESDPGNKEPAVETSQNEEYANSDTDILDDTF